MAENSVRRKRGAYVAVGLTVSIALVLALLSTASADDGAPPLSPTSCTADRLPFAMTVAIDWDHDGANAEKYVVERSRNGGEWFWVGAPLVPTTTLTVDDLQELDDYAFRIRTKAVDGTFSEYAGCQPVAHTPPRLDFRVDPGAHLDRPSETVGLGLGVNWLLDSDQHRPRTRSNAAAIDDLGAQILRFPFGHLADNYLWNTPPFAGPIEPRIASQHETPGLLTPTNRDWTWAVNADGTFIDAMDFDEFMAISQQTATDTIVVVNAAAHRYQDGPTYETLRETAVEWVHYVVDNDLDVDHWQIGNEADHPTDAVLTSAEYAALFLDFAAAMRAVDPSISVGPGLIGLSPYSDEVMAAIGDQIDFAGAHQYLQYEDHAEWRAAGAESVPNVANVQALVDASANPETPILVTETNSLGGRWANGDAITTTKALALFESLVRQRELPNVAGSVLWTSHTPWSGESFVGDDANVFFNDDANGLTPNGMAAQLFAETVHPQLVASPEPQRNIRVWSSVDPSTGAISVHVLNKGTFEQEVRVELTRGAITLGSERIVFAGASPDDPAPTRTTDSSFVVDPVSVTTVVPAAGLVVLTGTVAVPPAIVINEIHYAPAGDAAEFLELFNAEAEPVDLSGFELSGLFTFTPGTTVEAGGFVVLTDDLEAFHADHPDVPAIEWTDGEDLADDGELLELRTPDGIRVDLVDYR